MGVRGYSRVPCRDIRSRPQINVHSRSGEMGTTDVGALPAHGAGFVLWTEGLFHAGEFSQCLYLFGLHGCFLNTCPPNNGDAQFHPNKNIPTVTEHFGKEVRRALAVIELHLSRTGQSYLVGEKCTFVDLMYIPFNVILSSVLLGERFEEEWRSELPLCYAWHRRLMERETVKDALRTKEKAMQEMSVPDLS